MSGCCQELLLADFPIVSKVHQTEQVLNLIRHFCRRLQQIFCTEGFFLLHQCDQLFFGPAQRLLLRQYFFLLHEYFFVKHQYLFLEHCHLPGVRWDIPKHSQGVKHFFFENCSIPRPEKINIISQLLLPALKLFLSVNFARPGILSLEKTTM